LAELSAKRDDLERVKSPIDFEMFRPAPEAADSWPAFEVNRPVFVGASSIQELFDKGEIFVHGRKFHLGLGPISRPHQGCPKPDRVLSKLPHDARHNGGCHQRYLPDLSLVALRERSSCQCPPMARVQKAAMSMTKTHATGSAITYGMRYLLKMIFNLAVGDPSRGMISVLAVMQAGNAIESEIEV
jgi:hypothetical protein